LWSRNSKADGKRKTGYNEVKLSEKSIIIDFPNLGSTYNGGWCTATKTR